MIVSSVQYIFGESGKRHVSSLYVWYKGLRILLI